MGLGVNRMTQLQREHVEGVAWLAGIVVSGLVIDAVVIWAIVTIWRAL